MEEIIDIEVKIDKSDSFFEDMLDQVEALMTLNNTSVDAPLTHRFTPGLYAREIRMPAGSCIVSRIHNTCHPFVVSKGKVSVMTEESETMIEAPFTGITTPGTRRLLYCHTDVVWTTFHAIKDGETVEDIEERILDKHYNPYLDKSIEYKEEDLLIH